MPGLETAMKRRNHEYEQVHWRNVRPTEIMHLPYVRLDGVGMR
jgi:hypothetical protein